MTDLGSGYPARPAKLVMYNDNGCLADPLWRESIMKRRKSQSFMNPCSSTAMGSSFSSDTCSESSYTLSPQASLPTSPRTPAAWRETTEHLREVDSVLRHDFGKRKHGNSEDEFRGTWALPSVMNILGPVLPEQNMREITSARPKRRLISPVSSPEPSLSEIKISDDPITQSLNHGRRPEKGLLHRPNGLGDANMRFTVPPRQTIASYDTVSSLHYPCQQPSPPREEIRKERAKPKGTHCNVKYLPEEQDFIRYHKIDLKQSWNEVLQSFDTFQKKLPLKEELQRRIQGLQGVHYRENLAIPKPRRETNGRQVCFLPNGHVRAHECKVREQNEYKYMYGLVYLFPERAMDYTWVRSDHRRFAAELNRERIAAQAQAKRDAMERGTWVEKLEDNSCMCCEHEDRDMTRRPLRIGQLYENDYVEGIPYDARP